MKIDCKVDKVRFVDNDFPVGDRSDPGKWEKFTKNYPYSIVAFEISDKRCLKNFITFYCLNGLTGKYFSKLKPEGHYHDPGFFHRGEEIQGPALVSPNSHWHWPLEDKPKIEHIEKIFEHIEQVGGSINPSLKQEMIDYYTKEDK